MTPRRLLYAFGLVLAFTVGVGVSPLVYDVVPGTTARAETIRPDLQTFWKAWDIAEQNFVYRDALKTDRMVQGAIRGMIDALGDDGHSRYLDPQEVQLERSSLRGRFDGIGAEVNIRNGRPIIVAPIEGSPAERAGIRAGDSILAVDGEDVTSLGLTELVGKVRGARGTTVTLTVVHPGDSSGVDVAIVRGEVRVQSVTWAMVPDTSIGHVRINRFARNTTNELKSAIADARAAGADRLVVDVRNNPGGLVNEVVSTSSQFLSGGNVLLEENARGEHKEYPVVEGGVALDLPVVVLVNRGSASASEILAGAIQDAKRGQIVGERTFGTGTVLSPFDLGDGSQLYLGSAQWLTPAGRAIRKVGIKPDVAVALGPDARPLSPREERILTADGLRASGDTQLLKAIEVLTAEPAVPLAPAA